MYFVLFDNQVLMHIHYRKYILYLKESDEHLLELFGFDGAGKVLKRHKIRYSQRMGLSQ